MLHHEKLNRFYLAGKFRENALSFEQTLDALETCQLYLEVYSVGDETIARVQTK